MTKRQFRVNMYSNMGSNKSRRRRRINGIGKMLGQDQGTLFTNIVAGVADNLNFARFNVGDSLVGVWVAKNDGGADIGHVAAKGIGSIMDGHAALRVAAEHNLGVGTGGAGAAHNLSPMLNKLN